jgi:hypothetical protein
MLGLLLFVGILSRGILVLRSSAGLFRLYGRKQFSRYGCASTSAFGRVVGAFGPFLWHGCSHALRCGVCPDIPW